MAVREDDGVDALRVEGEGLGAAGVGVVAALELAAVDEDALSARFEKMAGAGDFARRRRKK